MKKRIFTREERTLIGELFKGVYWRAARAVLFFTLKASPVWIVPILMARIIDLGHAGKPDYLVLAVYTVLTLIFFIQNIGTAVLYVGNLAYITRGIGKDLRVRICRQMQILSLYYHRRTSVGKLHTKAIRDIELLETVPRLLVEQVYQFALGTVITVAAITIRAPGALVFFLVAVPVCAGISYQFRRRISRSVTEYRRSLETMSSSLNEMVTMMPITRAHGLEHYSLQSMEEDITSVHDIGVHFDRLTGLFHALIWVMMGVMQTLFLAGSMVACMKGMITIGDVVMFNSFFLVQSNGLTTLLSFLPQLSQARESLASVIEILNAPDLEVNSGKCAYTQITGSFECDHVQYTYPGTDHPAIEGLYLRVEAGQSLALTGPSGSGKSTLLALLLGFVRPDHGYILLDGKDMMTMDLRSYRTHVSVVTQEPVFFSGTVFENVAYGRLDMSRDRILDALEQANAIEFVDKLPNGIDTALGVNGVRLSGGQLQRLAIARAILRDPRVLVLDEATSALDTDSEQLVQQAIERIMKGKTTFIVAHRISTIRHADRIAILNQGRLVECDTPEALLGRDNFYSRAVRHFARISGGTK